MPHRQSGKADPLFRIAAAADHEAGLAAVGAVEAGVDEVVQRGDLFEQFARLRALVVIPERGDELDRLAQIGEIGLQLLGHRCVEHGRTPGFERKRCRNRGG